MIYDPATARWSYAGRAPSVALPGVALLPEGTVLLSGGLDATSGRVLDTTTVYDPDTGDWTDVRQLADPRFVHGVTVLGLGGVLVTGGITEYLTTAVVLDSAELYEQPGLPPRRPDGRH